MSRAFLILIHLHSAKETFLQRTPTDQSWAMQAMNNKAVEIARENITALLSQVVAFHHLKQPVA